jgi:hypothetical protein
LEGQPAGAFGYRLNGGGIGALEWQLHCHPGFSGEGAVVQLPSQRFRNSF